MAHIDADWLIADNSSTIQKTLAGFANAIITQVQKELSDFKVGVFEMFKQVTEVMVKAVTEAVVKAVQEENSVKESLLSEVLSAVNDLKARYTAQCESLDRFSGDMSDLADELRSFMEENSSPRPRHLERRSGRRS
jgi:DNA-binding protein